MEKLVTAEFLIIIAVSTANHQKFPQKAEATKRDIISPQHVEEGERDKVRSAIDLMIRRKLLF